jgi:hypothetical protein
MGNIKSGEFGEIYINKIVTFGINVRSVGLHNI